jgi:eukaryotic-like serine/threonine-protein kinase
MITVKILAATAAALLLPLTAATPADAASAPAAVVEAYYDAINAGDYQTAWDLGGKNFGGSFDRFADGFDDTLYDFVTIDYTSGDVVHIDLDAEQDNGSDHEFVGTYTVRGGEIVAAHLSRQ